MFGAVEAGDEAIAHGSQVVTREARQTSAPPSNGQEKLENKKGNFLTTKIFSVETGSLD